jgi:ketosteroid isomerase-like protein
LLGLSLSLAGAGVAAAATAATGCASSRTTAEAAAAAPVMPEDQGAAVRSVLEQWRQAYEVKSVDALARLYATADAVVVKEGSQVRGWPQIQAGLNEQLGRAKNVRVRLKDVTVVPLGERGAAISAGMTREVSDGVTTVTEEGLLTLALRSDGVAWTIVSEHYSYVTR